MRLSILIASIDGLSLHGSSDPEITGITADSRDVKPGFMFIAIPGTKHDGRHFMDEAVKRGAVAVLTPDNTGTDPQTAFVTAPDIRQTVSKIAARFYPQQPETIVAVTGTSGKTSTAQFTREIWQAIGYKSASIGTLGFVTADEERYGSLTTPDAITLHRLLEEAVDQCITHLAMEASSHGLALHRLENVNIKAAGFTNFSRDHLDFHSSMEDYFSTKLHLFSQVMAEGGTAVLNTDIPEFERLAQTAKARNQRIIGYGFKAKDILFKSITPEARGQILRFDLFGKHHEILLPIIGEFQAWNALCALGMVIGSGGDANKAVEALGKVTGVPGRLQLAGRTAQGAAIFVDYAHKPDALTHVLQALRPHVAAHPGAKLGLVFGCGGNRDHGKRPIMGGIAQELADWVIVTDDNPRNEQPAIIRQQILAGCKAGPDLYEIGDRVDAIRAGIEQLKANDVLVIAGKGHESGQIIGDRTLPFDDGEIARKVLGL